MLTHEVLLAVTGARYEAELLAEIDRVPGRLTVARRCLDLADLLAVAAAGLASVALVDVALRRLDGPAVARLAACGVTVVGVTDVRVTDVRVTDVRGTDVPLADEASPADRAGQQPATEALAGWGIRWVVPSDTTNQELARVLDQAAAGVPEPQIRQGFSTPWLLGPNPPGQTGAAARTGPRSASPNSASPDSASPDSASLVPGGSCGRLVAVWGPVGAPGRTTVSITLADELAHTGADVLLVDADTYGPSVAQQLALLDEGSGLAAAARTASRGTLSVEALAAHARALRPGLRVLTGLSRPERWPELSAAALLRLWGTARTLADWSVVDCGFCLEQDEELAYDTMAPRRNAATTTTLGAADVVLLVASADPVGVGRLVRALPEVRALAAEARLQVVLTQVRPGPVGRRPGRQLVDVLMRHGAPPGPVLVPYDRSAHDAALARGQTLREAASKSPARLSLAALAAALSSDVPRTDVPPSDQCERAT